MIATLFFFMRLATLWIRTPAHHGITQFLFNKLSDARVAVAFYLFTPEGEMVVLATPPATHLAAVRV
jgi:hypothetical protein